MLRCLRSIDDYFIRVYLNIGLIGIQRSAANSAILYIFPAGSTDFYRISRNFYIRMCFRLNAINHVIICCCMDCYIMSSQFHLSRRVRRIIHSLCARASYIYPQIVFSR